MKVRRSMGKRRKEKGIALLISIFVLLLISVVAIALIVSSGTESALAGNYRSSTGVYYASLAGLEEARERLLAKNPNSFNTTAPGFLPASPTPLAIGYVAYVLNPSPTDNQATMLSTTYPDGEYDNEFGPGSLGAATVNTTLSVWNTAPLNSLNIPGPLYKWVRINAVSEKSLKLDVGPAYNGFLDPTTPVYYDGAQLNVVGSGAQVLEVTALAVLPNGSQKLLQYLAAPVPITLPPFLAALTLSDSPSYNATFHSPGSTNLSYAVKGNNQDCNGNPSATPYPAYPAIGVFKGSDVGPVTGGIPSSPASIRLNYTGVISPGPDVENIGGSFPANLQKPSQLDGLVQSIVQNADVVITPTPSGSPPYLGTATRSDLTPLAMSTTNLLTVVVQGNLDLSNWSDDGDGLLLVTGTLTYDPDTTWNGIVLVIGQGRVVNSQNGQYKQINGAMFVAKTRDGNNNLLPDPNLGGAYVYFLDAMQGNGIRYSSCWIQKAQPTGSYKILSFHEISQ
jgi:hypothetical protein